MRLVLLVAAVAAFLLVFGCSGMQPSFACNKPYIQVGSVCCLDQNNNSICDKDEQAQPQANPPVTVPSQGAGAQANQTANTLPAGAGGETDLSYAEWKAPGGSITLQVPEGWKASEKQVDKCTVSWAVRNPQGTGSAFMNNQIMVFKSEEARTMYKSYGMTGIDSVPINGYLGAEQALSNVIAPLSGSGTVKVLSRDAVLGSQFSQAVCIAGLAACDAQVFEAAFEYKGTAMRGYYLVQTYDFGEGTAWWINLWGYEAPAADWEKSVGTLEKIFTSVKVTEEWAAKCGGSSGGAEGVIGEVIKSRQAASEKSAEEWDKYIRGE